MSNDVFDRPALMRLDVVERLGLRGEERIAGLATGAGYPDALDPIVDALSGRAGFVVDVGAGLGAAAAFIARTAAVDVKGVEPEERVARRAGDAFPEIAVVAGTADRLPFADRRAAGVTLLGAISLVEDLDAALSEATRAVAAGGVIAITDLCLEDGEDELRSGPNVFRSPSALAAALAERGCRDLVVKVARADGPTRWDDIIAKVDDAVEDRYGATPAGRAWLEDRLRLRRLIDADRLQLSTITATWSP